MTDLTAHDEAIAREAWKAIAEKAGTPGGNWMLIPVYECETLIAAARLGRERAPQTRVNEFALWTTLWNVLVGHRSEIGISKALVELGEVEFQALVKKALAASRTNETLPSPEHDEALIAEAKRRHPGMIYDTAIHHFIYRELLAMSRAGWTPEPDPDEAAVRAILGAWQDDGPGMHYGGSHFQAALAAYRQATRGEG